MSTHDGSRWPERLRLLSSSPSGEQRAELWRLVRDVLSAYGRIHAARLGLRGMEQIEDLASEKALDLVGRIDTGTWKPCEDHPRRLKAYLSTAARNGVVDRLRREGRRMELDEQSPTEMMAPDLGPERDEFVKCLRECVAQLPDRWRRAWLLRVFFDWSSKHISGHPGVRMKAAHVDVTLNRCRTRIGDCMDAKGLRLTSLPPGTFAALWETFVATGDHDE